VRVRPIHSSASPAGTTATQILVAEVSAVVDTEDVRRAATRARLLQRATGVAALAVVAGGRILGAAAQDAQAVGVWRVLDGRVQSRHPLEPRRIVCAGAP
jgi:hypothetical protein